MRSPRLVLGLALLAFAGSCKNDLPPPRSFVLPNGARVEVTNTGRITLLVDDRVLTTLPEDLGPALRTFEQTHMAPIGIWTFRRRDVQDDVLVPAGQPFVGDDESVRIDYTRPDGTRAGTLAIRGDGDERTRFTFTIDEDASASSIAIPFACDEDGSFHGFGEQYDGIDHRGHELDLFVSEQGIGRMGGVRSFSGDEHTTYFPMPYWLDARGHGVLFDTDQRTIATVCTQGQAPEDLREDDGVAWIDVEGDAPLSWTVFHGPTPLDVVRQLGDVVGRPAPIPDWSFGLWVASQGGRDDVLAEVDALEAAEIPVAAFWVQDWTGIRMNFGGGFGVEYRWEVDDELYPDLPGMVSDLHDRGYRFLAYANPFIATELDNHYPEMAERGLLMQTAEGAPYDFGAPNGMSAHPDLTNPEAQAYVKDALRAMVTDFGFDGWMHDFSEWTPLDAVLSDGRDPRGYHNTFPTDWQRMAREVFDELRPDGDYAFIARAGWTGTQEVAQIHWVGDQEATWEEGDGLPTVVPAMLSLGLAGQFHVTHDVAGFSGGPSTKELFLRWTELGAFTPIFRTHEGNDKENNWSWEKDAETTAHFRRFARIHLLLEPLFRRLADEAQTDSAPIVRALFLQYPEDRETWSIADQFLIGDELLVAPVVHEGETSRSVYLPAGTWFDVWTGDEYAGGQRIEIDAPIGRPPVFSNGADRTDLRTVE